MNIGDKIRSLRRTQRLTQEELAERMNVSPQAVSKWETGASVPDLDMIVSLALFFRTTPDDLLGFDRRRIDEEVGALVIESVPLRDEPEKAEAFYRAALEKYPNNEVLLNCLLMVIPNERAEERIRIGERLLESTADDEIRCDVLRLLAQTCHACGEDTMAEAYLAKLPELYFLKTEIAAAISSGQEREAAIRTTEEICFGTLADMLALRREAGEPEAEALSARLLELIRACPGHADTAERLERSLADGTILDFYA